jgi:hypothetical protein
MDLPEVTEHLAKLIAVDLGHEITVDNLIKIQMTAQTLITLMNARGPDHPDDDRQYVEVHWVWPDGRPGRDTVSVEIDPSPYRMAIDAVDLAMCGNTPAPDANQYVAIVDQGKTRVEVTVDLKTN